METPAYIEENFRLDRDKHEYFFKDRKCVSVTTVISDWFPPFNAEAVLDKYYERWQQNDDPRYAGLTRSQILKKWDDARVAGNRMHQGIEAYFNGDTTWIDESDDYSDDDVINEMDRAVITQFKRVLHDHSDLFRGSRRVEFAIIDPLLRVAGTIDFMCRRASDNGVVLIDWKRTSKDLDVGFARGEGPLRDFHDTKFNRGSLQLNMYKRILERHYGVDVVDMYLIQMHEELPTYNLRKVPSLEDDVISVVFDCIAFNYYDDETNATTIGDDADVCASSAVA